MHYGVILPVFLLFGIGVLVGAIDALNVTAWPMINYDAWPSIVLQLGLGIISSGIIIRYMNKATSCLPSPMVIIFLSSGFSLFASLFATGIWANSADEYGYQYVADTLARGRLWNDLSPIPYVFDFTYIYEMDGKRFSQYAPGWPVILMAFQVFNIQQFANPLLVLILSIVLILSLRELSVTPSIISALGIFVLLSPFLVFNGGSFFNGILAAACVSAICWLQLRDDPSPDAKNQAAIGVAFSMLLATRYEAFAITIVVFVVDRVIRRRQVFLLDAVFILIGALPITILLLGYHAAITGNPFTPPVHWVRPDLSWGIHGLGHEGRLYGSKAVRHLFGWTAKFAAFASLPFAALYSVALVTRIRRRECRFFDFLMPAAIIFFFLFPDFGGVQYGPRYWLFAWPSMALSVGAFYAQQGGIMVFPFFRKAIELQRMATLQAASYAGVAIAFSFMVGLYFNERIALAIDPPETPAVVLFSGPNARDFARNGVDFQNPVLYGRYEDSEAGILLPLACTMSGRKIFLWRPPAKFERQTCPE